MTSTTHRAGAPKEVVPPKSSISLPHRRQRAVAERLLASHPFHQSSAPTALGKRLQVSIVCISDTHNTRPRLPPGDILIHAGDLTENGSFEEVQQGLDWLSSQSHPHKIFIAGNHDVILDEAFLDRYSERRYGDRRSKEDLSWGSVTYLQDTSTTLSIGTQKVSIYGSPWTPQYGVSAFQYPRDTDIWDNRLPKNLDILITHGPPHLHLDQRDFHRAGCPYLAAEIGRVRPRLVVCGHIHASHGREDVVLDWMSQAHGDVVRGWAGWWTVFVMALDAVLVRLLCLVVGVERLRGRERVTTFVNASVVGGSRNELTNEAIVVEL